MPGQPPPGGNAWHGPREPPSEPWLHAAARAERAQGQSGAAESTRHPQPVTRTGPLPTDGPGHESQRTGVDEIALGADEVASENMGSHAAHGGTDAGHDLE